MSHVPIHVKFQPGELETIDQAVEHLVASYDGRRPTRAEVIRVGALRYAREILRGRARQAKPGVAGQRPFVEEEE